MAGDQLADVGVVIRDEDERSWVVRACGGTRAHLFSLPVVRPDGDPREGSRQDGGGSTSLVWGADVRTRASATPVVGRQIGRAHRGDGPVALRTAGFLNSASTRLHGGADD